MEIFPLFLLNGYVLLLLLCMNMQLGECKRKAAKQVDDYSNLSAYPTNFFTETYKKFVNNMPTIGIVAMKLDGKKILSEFPQAKGKDYFGASFVKLVEMAGGRAVPILEDLVDDQLDAMLHKINGIIMPGGDGDLVDSGYRQIAEAAVKYSRKLAKKGILFPILGICRGSQVIMQLHTDNLVLDHTDSSNLTLPLIFKKHAKTSRLFGNIPPSLKRALSTKPLTFNAHKNSVTIAMFHLRKEVAKHFNILTTNFDRRGVEFISTYEAKDAPIFGLQWHPEKSLFIFNPNLAVDHTIFATVMAQYMANTFVGMARQNPNSFANRLDAEKALVYRYPPLYVGNVTETPYEQVYLFRFMRPESARQMVLIHGKEIKEKMDRIK